MKKKQIGDDQEGTKNRTRKKPISEGKKKRTNRGGGYVQQMNDPVIGMYVQVNRTGRPESDNAMVVQREEPDDEDGDKKDTENQSEEVRNVPVDDP